MDGLLSRAALTIHGNTGNGLTQSGSQRHITTHVPRLLEPESGRFYVNSGDWVNHRSYVILPWEGAPQLHEWRKGGK